MTNSPRVLLRLAAAVSLAAPASALARPLQAQAVPDLRPSALEQGVDPSIRPGDDFFAYANGVWLRTAEIPNGKERWGARDEIVERTRGRLARVLDEARSAPTGSVAGKVADYRAAWLNDSAIDARALAPLRRALDSIDRARSREALTGLLGRGMRADVDPLNWGVYRSSHILGLAVEAGIHGEKHYLAFLVQGGLGMGDREAYIGADSRAQALRATYLAYISRMLGLAGLDRADLRAKSVLALETAIAATQADAAASANDHNADHLWQRADFAAQAPGMDWSIFLSAAGLADEPALVAWQPTAVKGLAALVASEPVDAWQDYLRFHLLDDNADVLPRDFSVAAAARHTALTGTTDSRAIRALAATQLALSDAIGELYAGRYFPPEQKLRVQRIVANVAAEFIKRVETATWMSAATRTLALAKLKSLYVGIGYPDRWQDYTDLNVDPLDAIGNLRRVADRNYRRALSRLGLPVDRTEWWIAPETAGAILVFQQNAYDFSAALLQPPKYDPEASDAAAYGAIGAIIGHDISHFVDRLGAEYDTTGAMRQWWLPDETKRFQALADPLVRQFSTYHPFPELPVNGALTASENVADLAGLSAAFDAYRRTLADRIGDRPYVRQQDREFFLAFAGSWRARLSDAGMRSQLAGDHAPEMYRVSTVRNLDAWYEAFDVAPGQRLYLEPAQRVRVW